MEQQRIGEVFTSQRQMLQQSHSGAGVMEDSWRADGHRLHCHSEDEVFNIDHSNRKDKRANKSEGKWA